LGDDRIRQLKYNIRLRANTEQCWDSTVSVYCDANSGRSRAGSARAFFQTTPPTALSVADANGSTTIGDGRLWIDYDGPDNNLGTVSDNSTLFSRQLGVWVRLMAMGPVGTATNDFKLWNGAGWANAAAATTTVATGTNADAVNTAVPAVLTNLTLAPSNPTAVIPATGSYMIHVAGDISIAPGTVGVYVGLIENDGTTSTVVQSCHLGTAAANSPVVECNFNYYKDTPTVSLTYTYGIEIQATAGGSLYNAEATGTGAFGTTDLATGATLQVVRSSKTLPTGF
jgi:hypothetical protein